MRVTSTDNVDVQEWDALAAALRGGYFHTCAEALCVTASTGAEPLFVKGLNEAGECVGLLTGNLALSRVWPFSRYCGYAMLQSLPATAEDSEEAERAFMEALEDHLRMQGAFSVRVYSYDSRNSECVLSALGYDLSPRSEFVLDLGPSLDAIWGNFTARRRTDIRKAERLGVTTRVDNTQDGVAIVLAFFRDTMRKYSRRPDERNEARIRSIHDGLESGTVDVLVTYQDDVPVNGALFTRFVNKRYYHLTGNSELAYKCNGNHHLIWTAIKRYKAQGAVSLNLGAVLEGQSGLLRFKRDFGAARVPAPIGVKRISTVGSFLHRVRSLGRG